ncbi:MAG TPA: xylulokinase [Acidobacteriaceae bacterium]|nr:xylulokinase [Acidobacteriaceae bacterium]
MLFLGIDVGTGGSRAVLINEAGKVVASHATEHVPFQSKFPGWAEQDPEDWWRASQQSIRAVLAAAACAPAEIAAVGLTGQMHGAVLLDADGQVLRPSLIWCDTRSGPECDWLHTTLGREHVIELTCNPALPNFTLTKILWVREHEPEIFARIAHILCPKDYVRFRLSGVYAMDVQEASGTLLLDVTHRGWSQPMAEASGVPMEWLPQLFESAEVCAKISKSAAAATGLVAGTPIVAGAGDQGAGAVGMGILKPGSVSATIGTSGVVFAATDAPIRDPLGRLHTFCHAVPGRWHVMGVTQAAGLSLRWFRDVISAGAQNQPASYEQLMTLAAEAPAGSDGVFWAPYLFGERTPHLDPDVRAAFVGLTASHRQPHLVRAVLEGVAYSLRDTFTLFAELGIPILNVRLGGGGARSPLWRQIQADVYGRAVEFLAAEEGAAYGTALLAGVGVGAWSNVDTACESSIQIAGQIGPEPAARFEYDQSYQTYRRIYPALVSLRTSR